MRLIAALVLVWLSTLHASVTPPQDPGHLFIPMGKIYPSYSSWAVTISINMSSYRNQLNDIGMAIDNAPHYSPRYNGSSPVPQ